MPEPRPTLGRAEAGPLLDALHDPSPETRLAVLEALTRLPLDPDCWLAVRRYVAWALEDRACTEHLEAIALAAYVPVESVRAAVRRLAEGGDPAERRQAALALGTALDDGAVEALLGLLGEPGVDVEAARLLARNDISQHRGAVQSQCESWPAEPRFWVALALARAGDDAELLGLLEGVRSLGLELELLWGDPSQVLAELRRGPAVPDAVLEHLRQAAEGGGDAGRLAQLIVEASAVEPPVEAGAPRPAPERPAITESLRARMRAALEAFQPSPDWRSRVEAAIEEVATDSDPRTATALAVSELFGALTQRPSTEGFMFGNEIVTRVQQTDGFVPDLDGLLGAYRPLAASRPSGGTGAQLGWTATRGGLTFLLAGLAPYLARPEDRFAAACLVADAAGYVSSTAPPIVGGESPGPEPPLQTELIDDMVSANGGGDRRARGLPPDEAAEAPPPEDTSPDERDAEQRWILARVTDLEHPDAPLESAFRAGGAHEVAVAIGPEQAGMLAATGGESFDRALGPTTGTEQLFVTFIPPPAVAPPQTGSLFLPPSGTSRSCTFGVQLPADLTSFEAQIQVYHRNRMVQLALLRGPVVADPVKAPAGSRIELELAVVRPGTADLNTRERFDAAMARTSAATTAVADEGLALFDNDRIDRVVPTLARILGRIATSEASRRKNLEDPAVVDDLRALAFQGCELHSAIAAPLAEQLGERTLDRLQVLVESACDFFPVEFVYDLPPPVRDAGLCPGWKVGLRTGTCPEQHEAKPPRGLADHVCPSGFWALSKVIERQVIGDESWKKMGLVGVEFAVRPHPTAERRTLEAPRVVLFGASSKVDQARKGRIAGVRSALERIAEEAVYADTWDAWVKAVSVRKPSLLVLLSHSAEDQFQAALEVGDGDLCLISQVEQGYVRSSAERSPIVLLLGCETAFSDVGLQTFVARFQDVGAALVVGTVASVVGERAAPVARTLAEGFATAAKRSRPVSVGDLLLELRRKLLGAGELTALCLTAFGDADWQLGGG